MGPPRSVFLLFFLCLPWFRLFMPDRTQLELHRTVAQHDLDAAWMPRDARSLQSVRGQRVPGIVRDEDIDRCIQGSEAYLFQVVCVPKPIRCARSPNALVGPDEQLSSLIRG